MEEKNYIRLFESTSGTSGYNYNRSFNYYEPWLSYTEENGKVNYNKTYEEAKNEYINRELTFEIISGGNLVWNGGANNKTVQYHKNADAWSSPTTSTTISVEAGDIVQFRGSNNSYTESHFSASTCTYKLSGNIMSLIYPLSGSFGTAIILYDYQCFYRLFAGCSGLTDAQYLMLRPEIDELLGDTSRYGCYQEMFLDCTNMVNGPKELPITALTKSCYENMFKGCTALVDAPEIKATTFADEKAHTVCAGMFSGCTSLVNGPSVLAAEGTYEKSGDIYNTPESVYYYMFQGCTSLVSAPILPAEKVNYFAYQSMFQGCSNLKSISCYATKIGGTDSYEYATSQWVSGVASNGVFSKSPDMPTGGSGYSNDKWTSGADGIPTNWSVIG